MRTKPQRQTRTRVWRDEDPPQFQIQRPEASPTPKPPDKEAQGKAQRTTLREQVQTPARKEQIPPDLPHQPGQLTLEECRQQHEHSPQKKRPNSKQRLENQLKKARALAGFEHEYLLKLRDTRTPLVLRLSCGTLCVSQLVNLFPHRVVVQSLESSPRKRMEKLDILCLYKELERDLVEPLIECDPTVRDMQLRPIKERSDRIVVTYGLVLEAMRSRSLVRVTLLDGTVLVGYADSHSRFNLKLRMPAESKRPGVLIFKHGVYSVERVVTSPPLSQDGNIDI